MSDESKSNDNAVAEIPGISKSLVDRIVSKGDRPAMSFDPTTPDGGKKYLMARIKELPSLKSMINKTLHLTDIYTHDIERADQQTGEVESWQRTVVYDADGNAYACGSAGVWDSLSAFMIARPQMPWNPPIKCEVKLRELGGGRVWMYLDVDIDELFRNIKKPAKAK